ncbi:hypothetical protein D7S89_09710 [Trinickia fusca]|uniref:Uncharacterized protein n=1 Tax=Trinickia fusca TaxID=2419777 RepID=A0A494XEA0_9BURK|nr:hypothetical protein D7S89_09710 [Trinickia fusca]
MRVSGGRNAALATWRCRPETGAPEQYAEQQQTCILADRGLHPAAVATNLAYFAARMAQLAARAPAISAD